MGESVAGRERVVIVDHDLDFGLKLADCLASSGYHAILSRSLDAMIEDLGALQPRAILLGSDSWDQDRGAQGEETLRVVKSLCPQVPVIALTRPGQGTLAGRYSHQDDEKNRRRPSALKGVEELLRTKFGIPCERVF